MKKLLLIRHANALHTSAKGDFERQLSPEGAQEAQQMADKVKEQGHIPQLIISSQAKRAKNTASIFASTFDMAAPQTQDGIYEGNETELLNIINQFPADAGYIALVGHNPDISNLQFLLTDKYVDMPTCMVALITFELNDWQTISSSTGKLEWSAYPIN